MAPKSSILSHPSRLQMERAYLQGKSIASIARDFSVSVDALRNHVQNNLSRQLVKAYEQKELTSSFNLLAEIDQIIVHTKAIFMRNYEKQKDSTALKALDSQRSTLELLCKISSLMHQTKVLEMQEHDDAIIVEAGEDFSERLQILTTPELEMLEQIQKKLFSQDPNFIIIPERPSMFASISAESKMYRAK